MVRHRALAYLALLLAVFIWGVNFLVVKEGINAWQGQKFMFLASRFWLACIVYALILLVRHRSFSQSFGLGFRRSAAAALVGVVLAVGYGFQTGYLAQEGNGPVKAAFLTSTTVLWAPFLARILGQKVYPATAIGAVLAMGGIILMEWRNLSWSLDWAHWLALFAAVAFAVEILLVSRLAPKDQSIQWTLISCLTVAVLMTGLGLLNDDWPVGQTGERIGAVIFTGLFATAIALGLQNWAQAQEIRGEKIITGPRAAIISTLEPVFTTLAAFSLVIVGRGGEENVQGLPVLGCALILVGTLVSEFAAAKRTQDERAQARQADRELDQLQAQTRDSIP
ncbi:MAG TPA: DMT family transporter [Pyrinomonadaceae bacterium]